MRCYFLLMLLAAITLISCNDTVTNNTRVFLYDSLIYSNTGTIDSVNVTQSDPVNTTKADSFNIFLNTQDTLFLVKFKFGGRYSNGSTNQITLCSNQSLPLSEFNIDSLYFNFEKELFIHRSDSLNFTLKAAKFSAASSAYIQIKDIEIYKRVYSQ